MSEHPRPHPNLAGYVLGVLDDDEAATYEEHLASCQACRDEVAALSPLPGLLEQITPPSPVPVGLRKKTLQAVERAASRRRRGLVASALATAAALAVVAFLAWPRQPMPFRLPLAAPDGNAAGIASITQSPHGLQIQLDLQRLPEPPPGAHFECWYVAEGSGPDTPRVSGGTFLAPQGGDVHVRMLTAADPMAYPRMHITLEDDGGDPAPSKHVVLTSDEV